MKPPDSVNHADVSGYLLETLTPEQRRAAGEHLAGCAECRTEVEALSEWTTALRAVPEAMLLDGPPDDADLLLQRTVRQVRGRRRRRTALTGSAAAAVVLAAVLGGLAIGRSSAPDAPPVAAASTPAGVLERAVTDRVTGATLAVRVRPAAGWMRVSATVGGIPAGERCHLEVLARDGHREVAGGWLVSPDGEAHGVTLDGTALMAADQVAAVRVVNEAGKQFASVAM